MIQLSKRLKAVADLVGAGNLFCIADVGTDHGYIPIYMVEQGISRKAIAMDINQGPLQWAKEHIREHGLAAYIETRLSDGLAALKKGEVEAIVIAGMGGATMSGILEAGANVIEPDTVLVLQPQSELREFRSYLLGHGFSILAEDMVCEDGKYYPMMKVQKLHAAGEDSEIALRFGPLLLAQHHPVLKDFLQWQLKQKQGIRERLKQYGDDSKKNASEQGDEAAVAVAFERRNLRIAQIEEDLFYIKQALQKYE